MLTTFRSSDNQAAADPSGKDAKWDTVADSGELLFFYWKTVLSGCIAVILADMPAVVDEFASKEGAPAGVDPEMNNVVNDEINKL